GGSMEQGGVAGGVEVSGGHVVVPWREVDLSHLQGEEQRAQREAWLAAERTRFVLTGAPLLRFGLVRLDAQQHLLVLTNHHVLLDGWSRPVLFRELLAIYSSGGDTSTLPRVRPYTDYLAWLGAQDTEVALAAWRSYLADLDGPTQLAGPQIGAPLPTVPERWQCVLSRQLTAQLQAT